jgi:methionyl-tRNA formyltransferase
MNIVLVGEESAGIQALRVLASGGHRIVAVMASPGRPGASVWSAARTMGLVTWDAARVKDPALADDLREADVDLLLNVHSLFVVHPVVLRAPRIGSYNLHPGPLPRYAGLNPVSWALYRGETTYGVSVHRMDPGLDTGPIAFQTSFAVEDRDTALSLYTKCIREGIVLVRHLLEAASQGAIPSMPQDLSQREYVGGAPPDDCRIRWSHPARDVRNLVRACDFLPFPSPWGHPRAALAGKPVHILKTRLTGRVCDRPPGTVGERTGTSVEIACGDAWLAVDTLLVDGRSAAASEVLGHAERLADGV